MCLSALKYPHFALSAVCVCVCVCVCVRACVCVLWDIFASTYVLLLFKHRLQIWVSAQPHISDFIRVRVGYAIIPSLANVHLGTKICFTTHLTEGLGHVCVCVSVSVCVSVCVCARACVTSHG